MCPPAASGIPCHHCGLRLGVAVRKVGQGAQLVPSLFYSDSGLSVHSRVWYRADWAIDWQVCTLRASLESDLRADDRRSGEDICIVYISNVCRY